MTREEREVLITRHPGAYDEEAEILAGWSAGALKARRRRAARKGPR